MKTQQPFALLITAFFVLFVASFLSLVESKENQLTIAGGRDALLGELPYAIGLKLKRLRYVYCGGAILNEKYILTAAHCFDPESATSNDYTDPETLEVVIGRVNLDDTANGGIYEVKRIMKHAQYNPSSLFNDIAIIELKRNITLNNKASTVLIENEELPLGMTMTLNGWGYINSMQAELPRIMRRVDVPLVQGTKCLVHGQFRQQSMLCAGLGAGMASCAGASGGAMTYRDSTSHQWVVGGIVSFGGSPCGARGVLGTYTKVSYYVPWIKTTVPDLNVTHPFRPLPQPSESPPPVDNSSGVPSSSSSAVPSSSSAEEGAIYVDLSGIELPIKKLPLSSIILTSSGDLIKFSSLSLIISLVLLILL